MRKNFRSDISIREIFYDIDQTGERVQSMVPENVRVEYFTPAFPRVRFVCSRNGGIFHNCSLDDNGRTLVCNLPLSRKSLGVGPLLKIVKFSVSDESFPYDLRNREYIASTGIDLWGGPSDAGELESESVLSEVILRYGYSAYRLAVLDGFEGTEEEWLASLIGPQGLSAYQVAVAEGFEGSVSDWLASLTGPQGDSAYQVAVDEGFVGTKAQWLASLVGPQGIQGPVGETPDISIGTVTTVEPGTPASASMCGTPEAPVLNLSIPQGLVGATPNFTVGTVTTGEPGTPVVVILSGTPEAPVLNVQIPQGAQGNTGSSVAYPFELVNNLTTNDATKALSAAQGKVLDGKVTELEAKVGDVVNQAKPETIKPGTWESGVYNSSGAVVSATGCYHTVLDITAYRGQYLDIYACAFGIAYIWIFDESGNIIPGQFLHGANANDRYFVNILIPFNAKTLGISNFSTYLDNAQVYVRLHLTASYINVSKSLMSTIGDNLVPIIFRSSLISWGTSYSNAGVISSGSARYGTVLVRIPVGAKYMQITRNRVVIGALFDKDMNYAGGSNGSPFNGFWDIRVLDGLSSFPIYKHPNALYVGLNIDKQWDENNYIIRFSNEDLFNPGRVFGNAINKPFDFTSKKITFFGDSITAGAASNPTGTGWVDLLCSHLSAIAENISASGRRICGGTTSIKDSILSYTGQTDCIFVCGGTNDFGFQSELGTLGDVSPDTFYGCLELISQYLEQNYPNIPVLFFTPLNRVSIPYSPGTINYTLNDYRNAIWEVAIKHGFNIIDGSQFAFPGFDGDTVMTALLMSDGLHPTGAGHSYLANAVAGLIC